MPPRVQYSCIIIELSIMKLCDSWNGSICFTICYKPMFVAKDIQETVFNYVGTPTINLQRKVVLLTNMCFC
jgi:hypothetical protein